MASHSHRQRPGHAVPFLFYVLLACLLTTCYVYTIHPGGGWNVNTRIGLIRAIVHHRRFQLSPADAARTGDKAEYPPGSGRFFCDKPIGAQILALPGYAVAVNFLLRQGFERSAAKGLASAVATWGASGLTSVALGLVFFSLTGFFLTSLTHRLVATLLYCLGTLAWPYSTILFGHQPAAAAGFVALAAAYMCVRSQNRKGLWAAVAGALAGFAVITEFPAIIIFLAVAGMVLVGCGRGGLGWYVLASLPVFGLQLAYNWACFGHPLRFGYQFEANPQFAHPAQWIGWPRLSVALSLLFSPTKGLLFFSPYLAFALCGLAQGLCQTGARRWMATACLAVFAGYFLYNSGHYMWWGGVCLGPRHLVPALPFLAFGLVFALHPMARLWRILLALAAAWSVAVAWLGANIIPEPGPAAGHIGLWRAAVGQLATGELDWANLGMVMGIKGTASLLPEIIVAGWLAILLFAYARSLDAARHQTPLSKEDSRRS